MTLDTISLLFPSCEKEDHWGSEETHSSSRRGGLSLLSCSVRAAGSPSFLSMESGVGHEVLERQGCHECPLPDGMSYGNSANG